MRQSHTATNEWQSFELRMRRRRVQRCVARATLALEAGLLDQAQAAIDEAISLEPEDEAARHVAERISIATAAPPAPTASVAAESIVVADPADVVAEAPQAARRVEWRAFAAAILVTMLAGASGWYWARAARWQPGIRVASTAAETSTPGPVPAPAAGSMAAPPDGQPADPSAAPGSATPAPGPSDSVTIATEVATVVATTGDSPGPPGHVERAPAAAAERMVPQTLATKADGRSAAPPPATSDIEAASPRNAVNTGPAPALRDIAVSAGPALPDAPAAPPPVPAPPAADPSTASALAAGSPISAGTPLPASVAPAADALTGERAVRAALSRYESAYSQLDAAAAGAVWPSVDRRALSRAFDGLTSQTIRLSRCDVRVNGSTAQADCTGSAQWTPKFGGGSQSAARRWRFELRQTGSAWEIVSANAR